MIDSTVLPGIIFFKKRRLFLNLHQLSLLEVAWVDSSATVVMLRVLTAEAVFWGWFCALSRAKDLAMIFY